ncbi:Uncharacterized protein {ECO:0000313/EMBL:ERM12975.1} [Pantoea ananatis]|nr:hypothetical protein L585_16625 [Pantoea ananatis BRT175]CRH29597.1 Uncharacterized protein {ECO:0000313/EMBL:ERM12975.1} [Pantoea ananatis]CRH34071.1 Uncharacterized protein BN1183_AZ_00250 [Pantoea ananatis]CRH38588.1 Uncharacterized protein {ECO:0000313/EMBL:ERM12975.1} [Pantoea ananatis]
MPRSVNQKSLRAILRWVKIMYKHDLALIQINDLTKILITA